MEIGCDESRKKGKKKKKAIISSTCLIQLFTYTIYMYNADFKK